MGLLDSINAALGQGMQSPLFNLGTSLIAGAQPFANPGQQLQAGAQTTQTEQQRQQQIAMTNMHLRFMGSVLGGLMGPPQGQGAAGTQQPAGLMGPSQQPTGLMGPSAPVIGPYSAAPSNSTAAQAPAAATSPFAVPTLDQIASIPIGGMSPQMLRAFAMMNGQSPVEADQQIRTQQLAIAKQQYGPTLAQLDTLSKAQTPTQYVKASPQLMSAWNQLAPSLGFDPAKGFTDPNVRTAFSFLRNQIAGALEQPTVAPPIQMSQVPGPLNSLYQRNPVTNALTQIRGEEGLKSVVGPNGAVTYVPSSQAAGRQAFQDETYVNPTTTQGMARMIANYEIPPLSGYSLKSAQGQAIMAQVKQFNPQYDSTQFTTKQRARQAFATGQQGNIVRSLSVATNHLDQLSEAGAALAQHNVRALNSIANTFGTHIGSSPAATYNAMREVVGDEVVKAVVGTAGAEGDRQAIKDAFATANSPAQRASVIEHFKGLMGGQLDGLRRQYQKATGLNDFDSFLSQQAQQALSKAPAGGSLSDAALLKKWGGQ